MNDDALLALILMGFSTLITLFCVGISQIKSIILKKEQIKADALIRAEEIKARNQLELEKLLHRDASSQRNTNVHDRVRESDENRAIREKINT